MSYDLWFWNQSKNCRHRPDTVVQRACEGGKLTGLVPLELEEIKDRLAIAFPGFKRNMFDAGTHYFTIDLYPPYVFQIVATPPKNDDVIEMLNSIIDIAAEFNCNLYDPQTGERFS